DHRLDGEEHALAHLGSVFRPTVMQDRGRVVEHAADAVAAEIAHHRIAVALGIALDRIADRADMHPRPHHRDAAHHRLIGDLDQLFGFDRDAFADEVHAAGIAVPTIEDHGHVDVQAVAVHQAAAARAAVAHDVVDRGAD